MDITHHAPLGKSEHSEITFMFNCYLDSSKPKEQFEYVKTDFEYLVEGNVMSIGDLWCVMKTKLLNLRINSFIN